MSLPFNLNREISIRESVDPFGRKWNIVSLKGSALYEARPEPNNPNLKYPEEFAGRWTKPKLLKEQIDLYLNRAWDFSDAHAQKQERKEYAKEVEAKEQAEVNKGKSKKSV